MTNLMCHNYWACALQLEKSPCGNEDPEQPKINKIIFFNLSKIKEQVSLVKKKKKEYLQIYNQNPKKEIQSTSLLSVSMPKANLELHVGGEARLHCKLPQPKMEKNQISSNKGQPDKIIQFGNSGS